MSISNVSRGMLLVSLVFASAQVAADPRNTQRQSRTVLADVVDVKPLIRTVEVEVPVRECYERPVRRAQPRASLGRTVAGGIIGGVLGAQVGDGSGQRAATVIGSVIGAAAANESAKTSETRVERYCETTYEYESRERVDGFRVTYEYLGEVYVTRTQTDPGDTIRVRISMTPLAD